MKQGIHPDYVVATVVCACGNRFETMSTQEELHVEICAVCHPFYTGKQRLVDTAGRVDRFKRKYGKVAEDEEGESAAEESAAAEAPSEEAAAEAAPEDTAAEESAEEEASEEPSEEEAAQPEAAAKD